MIIEVEFWQLVGLLLSFLGAAFAAGKILLTQSSRSLDDRFAALERARADAGKHWDEKFAAVLSQQNSEARRCAELEREFLRFRADLPRQFVLRDDYIRGQAVIEGKLDALYNKLEAIHMRGKDA